MYFCFFFSAKKEFIICLLIFLLFFNVFMIVAYIEWTVVYIVDGMRYNEKYKPLMRWGKELVVYMDWGINTFI